MGECDLKDNLSYKIEEWNMELYTDYIDCRLCCFIMGDEIQFIETRKIK